MYLHIIQYYFYNFVLLYYNETVNEKSSNIWCAFTENTHCTQHALCYSDIISVINTNDYKYKYL